MSAGYTFDVDPSRNYVRLRMHGFFTPEDLPAFIAARREAHVRLTCAANAHVTLNDIRELKIQSKEIVDGFSRMLGDSAYHARRLAFVITPGLLRTQVMRALAGRDDARCFESKRNAEAWLFVPNIDMPIQKLVGTVPLRMGA